MKKEGHIGAAFFLISTATVAGVLLNLIQLTVPILGFLALLLVAAYFLSAAPDKMEDKLGLQHRKLTHSLLFIGFLAWVVYASSDYVLQFLEAKTAQVFGIAANVPVGKASGALAAVVFFVFMFHSATDAASESGGFQVRPLYPVSDKGVSLGLYKSTNETVNKTFSALGWTSLGVLAVFVVDQMFLNSLLLNTVLDLAGQLLDWALSKV